MPRALCGAGLCLALAACDTEREAQDESLHDPTVQLRAQNHSDMLLFNPDTDAYNISYHSFRIPSIVRTTDGTLIAFAEGRQCSAADYGNINLVYKRSFNHGQSWTDLDEVVGAGAGTWGNPTAVVDEDTGRVFLFMSWNAADKSQATGTNPCTGAPTTAVGVGDRPVMLAYSDDEGANWSTPVDMSSTVQPAGTAWDAVGPGVGIQLSVGTNTGRLVVPAIERNIYSDNHGVTWDYEPIPGGTSEGTVVELSDGDLLRNDRAVGPVWNTAKRRWLSRGTIEDGFAAFAAHDTLYDPRVEGSAIRYTGSSPHRIVFLNPASTVARCKMRVRLSYDDGDTWPISRQLHDTLTAQQTCDQNLGGYSSMTKTADYHVGALVERIEAGGGGHRGIEFHRFNLAWILDGTPEPI
ncbi:sialidase family protein [Enhygromyxa salina]|uniref:exo-alpha-sialidase n=1 Tax=Enhygromyxa salina TaxID=215803 RepID=A0A2S9YWC7_9BACT|nr:sialidase family protein [Enhygromyxa salina]PRQ09411.1 Sialidase precursor [Enhygromyxa salina]